ncbi:MAG: hypothetical protein AAB367_04060 [Patescibacteria group bacterium]
MGKIDGGSRVVRSRPALKLYIKAYATFFAKRNIPCRVVRFLDKLETQELICLARLMREASTITLT